MYCNYCGKKIDNDSRFCTYCGSKLYLETLFFECELENVDDFICDSIIDTKLYFNELDKDDLYEGYSDREIKDDYLKVYECENNLMECIIEWNEKRFAYIVSYCEHGHCDIIGNIPPKYNKTINNIINNRQVLNLSGIKFKNGKYKEYDHIEDKIVKGFEPYEVELVLRYK